MNTRAAWLTTVATALTGCLTLASMSACVTSTESRAVSALMSYVPGLAPSAHLSGTPLVTGKVVDSSGTPCADVPVTAELWPAQEVLEDEQVGHTAGLTTIAVAVTDAHGTFALRVDPNATQDVLADGDQTITIDLMVPTEAGLDSYVLPVDVTVSAGAVTPAAPGAEHPTLRETNPLSVFEATPPSGREPNRS